jgi:hypothetical protein
MGLWDSLLSASADDLNYTIIKSMTEDYKSFSFFYYTSQPVPSHALVIAKQRSIFGQTFSKSLLKHFWSNFF